MDGTQSEAIHQAILAAFSNTEGLKRFVRFRLAANLEEFANTKNLRTAAFDLVSEYDNRGDLKVLIQALHGFHEGNRGVRAICEELFPDLSRPQKDYRELSESVGRSIDQLREYSTLLADSRNDFATIRQQIVAMSCYKALHECLHRLQVKVLNRLSDVAVSPGDPSATKELARYVQDLEWDLRPAQEGCELLPSKEVERSWIRQYVASVSELKSACRGSRGGKAETAVRVLERIVAEHSPRINALLANEARQLRLDVLLKAMLRVLGEAEAQEAGDRSSGAMAILERGSDDLQTLRGELRRLVEEHFHLQGIENTLRLIDSSIRDSLEELRWFWPDLKSDISEILGLEEPESKRARELEELVKEVVLAVEKSNDAKTRQAYNDLRWYLMLVFYSLDRELRELTTEIRIVAGPLESLVEVTANA